MKKILLSLVLCVASVSAFAQSSAAPISRYINLLSGYNVFVYTNGFTAGLPNGYPYFPTAGWGVSNVEFTTPQGQIVYSLTTNLFNTTLTNSNGGQNIVGDAFKLVKLSPDVNGDFNANSALVIMCNYTNLIPIAVTNSAGQYFTTNWTLALTQFPNWMYPANTNVYPNTAAATTTNTVTVNLFAVSRPNLNGDGMGSLPTQVVGESVASYSVTALLNGTTGVTVVSNLPATFLQKAVYTYATVTVSTNATYNGGQGVLINELGITQPQP